MCVTALSNSLKAILSLPIGLEDLSILNRTYLRSYMYTLESTDKELNDLELYFTYNDENKTESIRIAECSLF